MTNKCGINARFGIKVRSAVILGKPKPAYFQKNKI